MNFLGSEFSCKRLERFLPISGMGPEIEIKLGFQKNLKSNMFFALLFVSCKSVQILFFMLYFLLKVLGNDTAISRR